MGHPLYPFMQGLRTVFFCSRGVALDRGETQNVRNEVTPEKFCLTSLCSMNILRSRDLLAVLRHSCMMGKKE